jgi:sugar phosphate isomerase/epimerase
MQVVSFASAVGNWSRLVGGDFQVDVDELARAIPRMKRLNTSFIRVMSWTNKEKTHDNAAWRAEAIRRMRVLAGMAEDGGITMIHENCDGWGGDSPENTLELLAEVNSPALRTVFDTGNPFMHDHNALEYLRKTIHLVSHVHIKDGYKGEGGKHMFTYPNEGSCQVKACLRTLIEYGYDGGYSIEPHIAAIIHTGEGTGENMDEVKFQSYQEYGRRLMSVYAEAEAEARAVGSAQ